MMLKTRLPGSISRTPGTNYTSAPKLRTPRPLDGSHPGMAGRLVRQGATAHLPF